MRRYLFLSGVAALFVAEIIALIVFACVTTETRQDAVAVNEVAQTSISPTCAIIKTKRRSTIRS